MNEDAVEIPERKKEKHIIIDKKMSIMKREIRLLENLVGRIDGSMSGPNKKIEKLSEIGEPKLVEHLCLKDFLDGQPKIIEELTERILSIKNRLEISLF